MRSNFVSLLRQNTGIRLTFGFSIIFMVGYGLLFFLSTYLLNTSLQNKEQTLILTKITRYTDFDTKNGYPSLFKLIQSNQDENSKLGLLIQITGIDGKTKLLTTPYNWNGLNTSLDDWVIEPQEGLWFTLKRIGSNSDGEMLITSRILSNDFVIQVGRSMIERDTLISNFQEVFYRFMIPIFFVSVLLGTLLSWRSLRPIRDLIKTVKQIRIGDMDARVPVRNSKNELGELSELFNAMLEKIDALIEGMKESLDNVAHDLRTPLSRMKANLEMALQSPNPEDDREETLVNCVDNVEQISTMLKALLDITKAESGILALNIEKIDINAIIDDTLALYDMVAEEQGIHIEKRLEQDIVVKADKSRLNQVLANLVDNAIKYSLCGSTMTIVSYQNATHAIIEIHDQGIGINHDEQQLIFDRLYRADKSRTKKGLGLGLSIVKAIILAHQGSIDVESEAGKGAIFRISLPCSDGAG